MANTFAVENGLPYFETSAREDINVEEAIQRTLDLAYDNCKERFTQSRLSDNSMASRATGFTQSSRWQSVRLSASQIQRSEENGG